METKKAINKALRYNEGKLDWTLLDFEALEPLVKVMSYGAKKYTVGDVSGRDNWKKPVEPKQHLQSAMRHLISMIQGKEIDKESGERHSGHLLANIMMYNYHTKDVESEHIINQFRQQYLEDGWSKEIQDRPLSNEEKLEFIPKSEFNYELLKD